MRRIFARLLVAKTHLNQWEDRPPLGSSALSRRAIQENQNSGEKEKKKDESTDFKKVNNTALAGPCSYADRVRLPKTNSGCNRDYGAVADTECNSEWTSG